VSQLYNLEVQLHSGVPLSRFWEGAQATDIAVAHFSGAKKVWDCFPEQLAHVVGSEWVKQTFTRLNPRTRASVAVRCRALHAEWHLMLSRGLCKAREAGVDVGTQWTAVLQTGCVEQLQPHENSSAISTSASSVSPVLVGERMVMRDSDNVDHLVEVVRVREDGTVIVWRVPTPADEAFCGGQFGLCCAVDASARESLRPLQDYSDAGGTDCRLGSAVVAWSGEGHMRGKVRACREAERLIQFWTDHTPSWHDVSDVLTADSVTDASILQCATCLSWKAGSFKQDGLWTCTACYSSLQKGKCGG